MKPDHQNLTRLRIRKSSPVQFALIAKRRQLGSQRKRSFRVGSMILGAAIFSQIMTGQPRADQIYDLNVQEQVGGGMVIMGLNMDDTASIVVGVLLIKHAEQQLQILKLKGGNDPLYGTVKALGTNQGNTVSALALGTSSQVTAAGWGDTDAGTFHGIQWTLSGGTQDLGTLLGSAGNSVAFGISDDGSAIAGWSNTTPGTFPSGQHAFRWTQGGGMQDLGSLQGGAGTSIAYAANSDGSVVVGMTDMPPKGQVSVPSHAFRWTQAGGMQDLGSLGTGLGSLATAVNADGSIVVGAAAVAGGGTHAFRWTQASGMQDLGALSGLKWTTATSVSGDGNIIVGYGDPTVAENGSLGWTLSNNSRPFRWTQATGLADLNTLLANGGVSMTGITVTTALSITRDGTNIGGSVLFPTTPSGFYDTYLARHCDATNEAACALLALRVDSHDFNGDRKSDIAWLDNNNNAAVWLMNGATLLQSAGLGQAASGWALVGQRDFDGDGRADFLWHDLSGDVAIWFMNGTSVSSSVGVGNVSTAWSVAGTGDFNGDGMGDILWYQASGSNVAVWLMNGATLLQSVPLGSAPSTSWAIVGTGDFNADGKTDILWRDNSGNIAIWFMNGTSVSSSVGVGNVSTMWSVAGTGDFNGDGKSDILWYQASGSNVAVWLMNGATLLQSAGLGSAASGWSIAETGDFNGDGMSDILWYNNGNVAMWLMNGAAVSSSVGVGNVSTIWAIQGAGAD
jgi:probable HAF family extracellular repeat protein